MAPPTRSRVDLVLIALSSPLLLGVYKEGVLIESIESQDKTSEALPSLFQKIMDSYHIDRIFFARGPGSFMSIKLVYIFLKTLQITKNIKLFGCDGFTFNQNRPIKAMGNLYFVKENGKIVTKKLRPDEEGRFELPGRLDQIRCSEEISPLYLLPAVKV
ncbi:MAG: hypothetical protein C6H99_06810 [Epsilonproteobacteria bacterium]|nr:hypothetical protein [Campylobacterota bacterium]NPA64127.1 hypothetical protein [Campylobacterota bacterium]